MKMRNQMKKKMTLLHCNLLGSRYYDCLGSRYFSRDYSKVQEYHELMFNLIEEVSLLYSSYSTRIFDRISAEECADMLEHIVSGNYQLSPILVYHMKEDEIESFSNRKTVLSSSFCGLLRHYPNNQAGYTTFARPSTDTDVVLIAALEQVLLKNTVNRECPCIDNLIYDFHSDINKYMNPVNRIYRLDIDFPPDIGLFLTRLSSINLQPDTRLYQLITSFLNLSYIDEDGLCHESKNGAYTVGDISRIVQNLVFKEIFDDEFQKLFPGVSFTRFVSQVIIGTKDSDEVLFNEEAGYALLKSLGLTGHIVSIGQGDSPIPICGNKLVFIDNRL